MEGEKEKTRRRRTRRSRKKEKLAVKLKSCSGRGMRRKREHRGGRVGGEGLEKNGAKKVEEGGVKAMFRGILEDVKLRVMFCSG